MGRGPEVCPRTCASRYKEGWREHAQLITGLGDKLDLTGRSTVSGRETWVWDFPRRDHQIGPQGDDDRGEDRESSENWVTGPVASPEEREKIYRERNN